MPLDGQAWAASASRFLTYAFGQTDERDELTPSGGGTAIPFVHDEDIVTPEQYEDGALDFEMLYVLTTTLLDTQQVYTWGGSSWTVVKVERDRMAGNNTPHGATLKRHVE